MNKKFFVLFFRAFFVLGMNAGERERNYGDILIVDTSPFFMLNINYRITGSRDAFL
jgi:hypothetical protein